MGTRWLVALLVAATVCYSKQDVMDNVCWAMCRTQDGTEKGSWDEKSDSCFCSYQHKFKEYTKRVIKIHRMKTKISSEAYE